MVILGIDPGLATIGFGVIESIEGKLQYKDCGIIKTLPKYSLEEGLCTLNDDIQEILETFKPEAVGVEELYFAKNTKTAIKVAHARGVILQSIANKNIPMFHFTPLQVKNNITGDGGADKWQMQEMVMRILGLNKHPTPDDAADALAIAICAEKLYKPHLLKA